MQNSGRPYNSDHLICLDTGCGIIGGPLTAVILPEREFISILPDIGLVGGQQNGALLVALADDLEVRMLAPPLLDPFHIVWSAEVIAVFRPAQPTTLVGQLPERLRLSRLLP